MEGDMVVNLYFIRQRIPEIPSFLISKYSHKNIAFARDRQFIVLFHVGICITAKIFNFQCIWFPIVQDLVRSRHFIFWVRHAV